MSASATRPEPVSAGEARIQAPPDATSVAQLRDRLRAGDRLTITLTDASGTRRHGRFVTIDDETRLLVDRDHRQEAVAFDRIARIRRRRNGVTPGAIIGAAAGAALSIPMVMYLENEGGNEAAGVAMLVGMGLGAGVGLDALLSMPRTVYERQRRTMIAVIPLAGPERLGVVARVRF